MKITCIPALLCFSFATSAIEFKHQTIDDKVGIGYGLAIADVNGDKKPDILLADADKIVWYENPGWKKHVIADKLTERDHVCIAARDINGDGKAEIAVGEPWGYGEQWRGLLPDRAGRSNAKVDSGQVAARTHGSSDVVGGG
jgi:hypothetical protein